MSQPLYQMEVLLFGNPVVRVSRSAADLYAWATSDARFVHRGGVFPTLRSVLDHGSPIPENLLAPAQDQTYDELVRAYETNQRPKKSH